MRKWIIHSSDRWILVPVNGWSNFSWFLAFNRFSFHPRTPSTSYFSQYVIGIRYTCPFLCQFHVLNPFRKSIFFLMGANNKRKIYEPIVKCSGVVLLYLDIFRWKTLFFFCSGVAPHSDGIKFPIYGFSLQSSGQLFRKARKWLIEQFYFLLNWY